MAIDSKRLLSGDTRGAMLPMTREEFDQMPDDEKWHAHAAAAQANSAYRATLERTRTPGIMAGLPWWVRVAVLNFPVAVALFFMGQSAGVIPSVAQAQTVEIGKLNATISGHVDETEKLVARLTTALRVMCENAARDDVARNNCRNIGGGDR